MHENRSKHGDVKTTDVGWDVCNVAVHDRSIGSEARMRVPPAMAQSAERLFSRLHRLLKVETRPRNDGRASIEREIEGHDARAGFLHKESQVSARRSEL